MGTRSNMM